MAGVVQLLHMHICFNYLKKNCCFKKKGERDKELIIRFIQKKEEVNEFGLKFYLLFIMPNNRLFIREYLVWDTLKGKRYLILFILTFTY